MQIHWPLAALLAACSVAGCNSSIRSAKGGSSQGATGEPLTLVEIDPPPGRVEVGPSSEIVLLFSEAIDPDSVGDAAIVVTDLATSQRLAGTTGFVAGAGQKSLSFRAEGGLRAGSSYRVDVSPELMSMDGIALGPSDAGPSLPAYFLTFSIPPVLPVSGPLTWRADSSSSIVLSWGAASDNTTPQDQIVYLIYLTQGASPGAEPGPIDYGAPPRMETGPGVTTDVLTRLEASTKYRAAVRARDLEGNLSAPSNEIVGETLSSTDSEPPQFEGIATLESRPDDPHALHATWKPAVDATPASEIRYNIYVALEAGKEDFSGPQLTTEKGAVAADIAGLSPDTQHFVVVRAVDTAGNEDRGTVEASARTAVSYKESVFPILNLPALPSPCWAACTNARVGGCARATCHVGARPAGDFNVTTYDGLLKSGDHAPRNVIPFQGATSALITRLRASVTSSQFMPRGATCALGADCISRIERWIDQGALNN